MTFLWLWPATDHEPHYRHVPINKNLKVDWIYSTKRMMTQSYGWNRQRLQHSRNKIIWWHPVSQSARNVITKQLPDSRTTSSSDGSFSYECGELLIFAFRFLFPSSPENKVHVCEDVRKSRSRQMLICGWYQSSFGNNSRIWQNSNKFSTLESQFVHGTTDGLCQASAQVLSKY